MFRTIILVALAGFLTLHGRALVGQNVRTRIVIGESLEDNKAPEPGKLHSPFGIDFDRAGNMFIAELEGGRVNKLDRPDCR